jgi:hypothetical protein
METNMYVNGVPEEQWLRIQAQQQAAQEVREVLELVAGTVSLAGGAPRDWLLGREATDLDFFVPTNGNVKYTELLKRVLHVQDVTRLGENLPDEYKSEHIDSVHETYHMGHKVQIIQCQNPFSMLGTFPCNASKVYAGTWWSSSTNDAGVNLLMISGSNGTEQREFFRNKKLIFEHDANVRYVEKMLTKFPEEQGYEWIVKEKPSEQRYEVPAWSRGISSLRATYLYYDEAGVL